MNQSPDNAVYIRTGPPRLSPQLMFVALQTCKGQFKTTEFEDTRHIAFFNHNIEMEESKKREGEGNEGRDLPIMAFFYTDVVDDDRLPCYKEVRG